MLHNAKRQPPKSPEGGLIIAVFYVFAPLRGYGGLFFQRLYFAND